MLIRMRNRYAVDKQYSKLFTKHINTQIVSVLKIDNKFPNSRVVNIDGQGLIAIFCVINSVIRC